MIAHTFSGSWRSISLCMISTLILISAAFAVAYN